MCTYYVYMNITLSADQDLVERARRYAADHGTSLNQLIRDHLEHLVGDLSPDAAAAEFVAIARSAGGDSVRGDGPAWSGRDRLYADRIER